MLKKIFLGMVFLISFSLNLFLVLKDKVNLPEKQTATILPLVKVARVIDGDTLDLEIGERIRLVEVNAPEYPKGCLSDVAKERLTDLLLNKTISLQKIKKDSFGRTLSYVYLDDIFINKVTIEEGLAYFKKDQKIQTDKTLVLEKAQEMAKKLKRGVWSSLCQTTRPDCLIKGNYREGEHSRIYHTPDCYNYDRIVIKPGTQDRWFCTEEEATKAGFVKSKDCPL